MLNFINKQIFTFFLLTTLLSCTFVGNKNIYKDFKKSITDSKNIIRLDGYYYSEVIMSTVDHDSEKLIRPIVLYKDGTARVFPLFSGIWKEKNGNFISRENSFKKACKIFENELKKIRENRNYSTQDKWGWGSFRVNNDNITIQYYVMGGTAILIPIIPYTLGEYRGIIMNDSTFVINKRIDYNGESNEIEIEQIYKFRKYSVKPDSINWTQDI